MKIFNDKKIIILIVILVVFTLGYFIIANRISYAFADTYDANTLYNDTMNTIEKCAEAYAKDNLELFKDEQIIYIKVQDLIDNSYLVPNEDGEITNPLKENTSMNSNVIKLKYENEEISVEVDS